MISISQCIVTFSLLLIFGGVTVLESASTNTVPNVEAFMNKGIGSSARLIPRHGKPSNTLGGLPEGPGDHKKDVIYTGLAAKSFTPKLNQKHDENETSRSEAFFRERKENVTSHRRNKRASIGSDPDLPIELKCRVNCNCFHDNQTAFEEVFKVLCNETDMKQPTILSSAVFDGQDEPLPGVLVYVLVENVSSLTITSGFVTRWLVYTSCAMDLYNVGDISLPGTVPSNTNSNPIFAGLGIKHSRISGIPHGIFGGRREYGLFMENVTMSALNIYNLVHPRSKMLRYLKISNSIIGVIQKNELGNVDSVENVPCCEIKIAKSIPGVPFKTGITILNSQIGVVESHALNVVDTTNQVEFSIENSQFGIVEPFAIKVSGHISPNIKNTSLNLVSASSLLFNVSMGIQATKNTIILPQYAVNSLNCERNDIEDNIFVLVQEIDHHNENAMDSKEETDSSASVAKSLDEFVHPSCVSNNKILNVPLKSLKEFNEDTLETTASDATAASGEVDILFASNSSSKTQPIVEGIISTSGYHVHIHKGVVYIALTGLCGFVIILIVLAGLLVRKNKNDSVEINNAERERRPSLMYMTGSSIYGNENMWPTPIS